MSKREESKFWEDLRVTMGKRWDATRMEHRTDPGIPDVTWGLQGVQGWFELKIGERPQRPTSQVPLRHLTPAQCLWLSRRDLAGSRTFLYLKVIGGDRADMYYLIRGRKLFDGLWNRTENEIASLSSYTDHWINPERLTQVMLTNTQGQL